MRKTYTSEVIDSKIKECVKITGDQTISGIKTFTSFPILPAFDSDWQKIELDISTVQNIDKNEIEQIIISVVNADEDNTFYLDNIISSPDDIELDFMEYGTDDLAQEAYGCIWLEDYSYRKKISLTGQSGAGTNYQVLLKVGENSGSTGADFNLSGHCKNFPNDIRFTDDDKTTQLSHWLEKVEGDSPNRVAYFWVKIIDDLDTNQDIYIYYGKENDTSASNGNNTFLFFDDFNDNSYNTDKWATPIMGEGTYSESDGVLKLKVTGSIGPYRALTKNFVMSDGIIEMKAKLVSSTNIPHIMIDFRQPANGGNGEFTSRGGYYNDIFFHDGSVKGAVSFTAVQNQWHFMHVKISGSNAYGYIKNLTSGAEASTSITNLATLTSPGHLGPAVWNATTEVHYDDFRVRKYASVEPSFYSADSEEILSLLCYSEPTLKTQGSYSLKVVAKAVDSINKTLTRTLTTPIDLSDQTKINFDILATRSGSNIKIGIKNSNGTTTEITPFLSPADNQAVRKKYVDKAIEGISERQQVLQPLWYLIY